MSFILPVTFLSASSTRSIVHYSAPLDVSKSATYLMYHHLVEHHEWEEAGEDARWQDAQDTNLPQICHKYKLENSQTPDQGEQGAQGGEAKGGGDHQGVCERSYCARHVSPPPSLLL